MPPVTDARGRKSLSLAFWVAFVGAVAGTGFILLPACGLLVPGGLPEFGWNFCPATPATLSAEVERGAALKALAGRLELELAEKNLACASIPKPPRPPLELPTRAGRPRPQQTALLKPPPPPPPPPRPQADLPADRWARRDLGVLQGCWQLGHQSVTTYNRERCTVLTGRVCFGESGTGTREMTTRCPSLGIGSCTAPITATFGNDGTISTTQPVVPCTDGSRWNDRVNAMTCRRIDDAQAICRDGLGFEHEFRR